MNPHPCFVPGTVILCEDYGYSLLLKLTWGINTVNLKMEFGNISHMGCLFRGVSFWVWSGSMNWDFSWRLLPSFQSACGNPRLLSSMPKQEQWQILLKLVMNVSQYWHRWSMVCPYPCEEIVELKMKAGHGKGKVKDFTIRLVLWS